MALTNAEKQSAGIPTQSRRSLEPHEHGPGSGLGEDIYDTARYKCPIDYRAGSKS